MKEISKHLFRILLPFELDNMKIAFLQIFLVLLCLSAQAQKVLNNRAEQRGQVFLRYSDEYSNNY
jgi:hypothetical protein